MRVEVWTHTFQWHSKNMASTGIFLPQGSASPVVAAPGNAAAAMYLGAHQAQQVRFSEQFAPLPGVSTSIEVENIEELGSIERH